MDQFLRIVAIVLWIAGLVLLLGAIFPIFPSEPLIAIACFLASYTVRGLA